MADDSRLSSIIDSEGRLFGLINVIDAVVLGLALLVIGAGIMLWAPVGADEASANTETRYVTAEMETQPTYIAEQIEEGDEWNPGGTTDSLTITDVYQYPSDGDDGDIETVVRAQINGSQVDASNPDTDAISFDGNHLRYGSGLQIQTSSYDIEGTVVAIDTEDATLSTESESFVLQTELPRGEAETIEVGDGYRLGDTELVVLETVTNYPIPGDADQNQRVIVGVTGDVLFDGETPVFGTQHVRTGADITVHTQTYDLSGEVIRVGSAEEPGTPDTRTATVELEDVSPERVDALRVGLTEGTADFDTAEIVNMTDRPAEETVVTDDEVTVREHPINRDVTLAVDINVREGDDGEIRFRGDRLEIGDEITFDFGEVTVDGELTELD